MALSAGTVAMLATLPSKEVATNIDADGLNKLWDKLTEALDAFEKSIPDATRKLINQAISDWQDFYFGEMGQWPADGVVKWRTIYQKTLETLSAAIPLGATPETPVNVAGTVGKQTDDVFYITGKTTPSPIREVVLPVFTSPFSLTSPAWLGLFFVGIPVATYLFARKKRAS